MKFFLEFTTNNYKVRHALARELSRLFPGSRFAGTTSSHKDVARRYLEQQTDVTYELLPDPREVIDKALCQEADAELLRSFEKTLPEKSLWRFIAVDREWGSPFVKGVCLPDSYIQTINSQDNILKVLSGLLKFYNRIVADDRPDVWIPAAGQNSMTCPIAEQVCKNSGILYLMPETVRTQNYMALTDNRQCTFSVINDTCRQLLDHAIDMDLSSGEKIYNEIMADLENTKYFDVSSIEHLRSRLPWLRFLYKAAGSVCLKCVQWQREKPLRRQDTVYKQPDRLKTFFANILYVIRKQYRRFQLTNRNFYDPFAPQQQYVYFPLHSANEYSTQVQGTMWINQLQIIEALAKSIPFDWKIVVKEHPGMLLWRIRPQAFYDEIKNYANVMLIPADTSSHAVISQAQMIVTIVGTTGWEAIMRGKPVINLEENMFDVLGLSRRCSDLKELSVAIYEEMGRIENMSSAERKRRIVCLLAAIHKHGFWVDDPLIVTGDAPCASEQEASKTGNIIAQAIKDYLDLPDRNDRTASPVTVSRA